VSNPVINYRPFEPESLDDLAFVFDGWSKSFKKSPFAGIIPNNHFTAVLEGAIAQLLGRGMQIYIAESEDPATMVGFVAFETAAVPVLHYVYVKPVLRDLGFGSKLLNVAGITPETEFLYTFRTSDMKKFKSGTHCPAVARRKELEPIYAENPGRRGKGSRGSGLRSG